MLAGLSAENTGPGTEAHAAARIKSSGGPHVGSDLFEVPGKGPRAAISLGRNVLHRQELLPVDLTNIVHTADVRVADLSRQPDLRMKVIEPLGIVGEILRQEFQCNCVTHVPRFCA